ncbi:hypothetical protein ACLI09_13130 [Flavobacterium sp. RHBU_24]|uniref:hypothetical protein n=1 Tax=Flavobacterium sp. RHBU_24 TaxID=3391185 RepID=UPI003984DFBA
MDDMHTFYLLKQNILAKYREAFPFYTGSIQGFGNREIAQLIDLVEKDCHERVSEKWVYTHLKPETNQKLPRRDMLDIFCKWTGAGSWEEFVFSKASSNQPPVVSVQIAAVDSHQGIKKFVAPIAIAALTIITGMLLAFGVFKGAAKVSICLKDKYTQKPVEADKVSLYLLEDSKKTKLTGKDNCFMLALKTEKALVAVESAYYKADTLTIESGNENPEFDLQPDDYAMMVRAYMNGNVADWKKRRQQLSDIISDDAVIQEVMFDDIGVEFLNKQEYIDKVTTPGIVVKNMEVVEIKYDGGKIISLKFMQKGK